MTLDEAIKHAEEVAEEKEKLANTYESFKDYGNPKSSITSEHKKCLNCAKEHRQLAEWLKDYKRLLEQMPCEDCIDRKTLLTDMTICDGIYCNECSFNTSDEYGCLLEERIKKIPSVTPQPKIGRWKRKTIKAGCFVYGCNQCGWQQIHATNFCPDCGAKMEEVEE